MPKTDIIAISEEEIEEANKDFAYLLDTIGDSANNKKMLWKQIHSNAIADRHNAFLLFRELYDVVMDDTVNPNVMKSTEAAVHGKTLSTYLERMAKANDQLLKLADLIAQEEAKAREIDADSAWDAIQKAKDKK